MINRVYTGSLQALGGGREQFVKSDEVSSIKRGTFHYAARAGSNTLFGKGGAFSSYIEFEHFIDNGITLNVGDALLYAQEWDTDTSFAPIDPTREQAINIFYVKEIKNKRDTIYVIAYDAVSSKLDVDFSETLKANEPNFPMTIDGLCVLVDDLTGILPPWHSVVLQPPGRDHYWKQATIHYFYSAGITARDIYNWIGEIAGYSLIYLYNGEMATYGTSRKSIYKSFTDDNDYWQQANKYIVCPGDGTYTVDNDTAINAWYKEKGLEVGKAFATYDGVEIVASNGTLLGSYYTAIPATNILRISNNMIAENIDAFADIYNSGADTGVVGTYNDLAQDVFGHANVVAGMTSAKIELFPFRCPYTIGSRMYCVDTDGNTFVVPVMSVDITESGVTIGAYGNEYADDDGTDSISTVVSNSAIWSEVNQIKSKLEGLLDFFYPIGSIYMSADPTDPADLFGGTWEQIKDTFLLTAGDIYDAGDTGGEATHTLTITEMPSHTHDTFYNNNVSASGSNRRNPAGQTGNSTLSPGTSATGGGQAHNNMPPYLVVYAWQRVADEADYLVTIDGDYLTTVDGDYLTL